jgi:hypothetical protein
MHCHLVRQDKVSGVRHSMAMQGVCAFTTEMHSCHGACHHCVMPIHAGAHVSRLCYGPCVMATPRLCSFGCVRGSGLTGDVDAVVVVPGAGGALREME